MTLQRLNEHLNMVLQLQSAREALGSLQSQILKATNYDGMPHAHEASRNTENLAILLETQLADVNRLESAVDKSEAEIRRFVDSIEDNRTKLIFNLRFLCGLKWEAVAVMIGGGNTEKAVKSTCYRFLNCTDDEICSDVGRCGT